MQSQWSILEFIKSISVNTAIDTALCHLFTVQPPTPRDTYNEFIASLRDYENEYYLGVQASFEATVRFLDRHGYTDPQVQQREHPDTSLDGVSLLSLRFCVPLSNGGAFDLFPGGSCVSVTAATSVHFLGFLSLLRQASLAAHNAGVPNFVQLTHEDIKERWPVTRLAELISPTKIRNAFYAPTAHTYLPLAAELHQFTDPAPRAGTQRNYGAILNLITAITCDARSPWYIRHSAYLSPTSDPRLMQEGREETFATPDALWAFYGVTNAVPFNGHLYSLEDEHFLSVLPPDGAGASPIPLSEAPLYVNRATAALATLQARHEQQQQQQQQQEAMSLNASKHAAQTTASGSLSASLNPYDTRRETSPQPLVDQLGFELYPGEREFWDGLDALRQNPDACFPRGNRMSFVLTLPRGKLRLKLNGEFIAVTKHNLDVFIDSVLENKEKIHSLYAPRGDGAAPMAATPPSQARDSNFRNVRRAQRQPPLENAAVSPPSLVAPSTPVSTSQASPLAPMVDAKDEYPTQLSRQWNTFTMTADDLRGGGYIDQIMALENEYENGQVTDSRLSQEKFYIPTRRGPYELIPNGRQISVNSANAREYFCRIRDELDKLDGGRAAWETPVLTSSSSSPASHQHHRPESTPSEGLPRAQAVPQRTVLDDRDLLFLRELMGYTEQLRSHPNLDVALLQAHLDFSIYFPEKHFSMELIPNGVHIPVTVDNFNAYFALLACTHDEIVEELLAKGRYVIPAARRVDLAEYGTGNNNSSPTTTSTTATSSTPQQSHSVEGTTNNSGVEPYSRAVPIPPGQSVGAKAGNPLLSQTHNNDIIGRPFAPSRS